jgi:glycosyltransferase involved in cell wall biosynthesis
MIERDKVSPSSRMNICVIFGPCPSRGPDTIHLANFLRLLEPLAEGVFVIGSNLPRSLGSSRRVHVSSVDRGNSSRGILMRAPKYLALQLRMSRHLIRVARRVQVVILGTGAGDMILPALWAKLAGKRIISMRSGTDTTRVFSDFDYRKALLGKHLLPKAARLLEGFVHRLCDRVVIFRSEPTAPELERCRNKVIAGGSRFFVDTNLFRVETNLDERQNLVAYFGHLDGLKGAMNFVKAIPPVLKRAAVSFLICGNGVLRHEIEGEIRDKDLAGRVSLVDWVPHREMPAYLNRVRLLVIPSYAEVGPQILFEAIACGTPVLATPVGIIPDVIKDGETGFIMEDNSPQCIARNVLRALASPDLGLISRRARALVEKEYTREAATERYRNILESISNGKGGTNHEKG